MHYLPAEKDRLRMGLLFRYARGLLRRRFFSIALYSDLESFGAEEDFPLILFGNHSSWWDGLMETLLFERLQLDYYVMMEARNLRKFSYFQKTGVFGVDLESREGRSQGLLYAARLLREKSPRRTLLLYPHGRLVTEVEEWPPFASGLHGLLRLIENARARPYAKRLLLGKYPRPEAFLRIGPPVERGPEGEAPPTAVLEEALRVTYGQLTADVARDSAEDRIWLQRPPRRWMGKTD